MKLLEYGEWTIFTTGYTFYGRDWSVSGHFIYRGKILGIQRSDIIDKIEANLGPDEELRVFYVRHGKEMWT